MKLLAVVVASSVAMSSPTLTPFADPATAEESLSELAGDAFPEILEETQESAAVTPVVEEGEIVIEVDPSLVELSLDGVSEIVAPPTMTLEFATGDITTQGDGVYKLEVEDQDSVAFLQETQWGYRIITTIGSNESPTTFSYAVELPNDTRMDLASDLIYMVGPNDEVLATLELPWAKDANGIDVPTHFTWNDGVLTQHVELTGAEAFPISADPAWSYSYSYNTGKTPTRVEQLLRSCFNCYFPVAGAPRAFPTLNQRLPLTVGFNNYECTMGRVERTSTTFNFGFVATRNHFHGFGSTIKFSFRSDRNLYVNARVNNTWLNNIAYRAGAAANWAVFASNLRGAP